MVCLVGVVQGLQQATWPEAFAAVKQAASGLKGSQMRAIAGKLADAESMVALKDMFNRLGAGDLRVSWAHLGWAGLAWAGMGWHGLASPAGQPANE